MTGVRTGFAFALVLVASCHSETDPLRLPDSGIRVPVQVLHDFDDYLSLESSARTGPARFLVEMKTGVDLVELHRLMAAASLGKRERRQTVAYAHARVARGTQKEILATIEKLSAEGMVSHYRSITIVNSVLVTGTARALEVLRKRPDVRGVILDVEDSTGGAGQGKSLHGSTEVSSWAVPAVGVEFAWERGIDGSGVVVGLVDAGASASHQQLRDNHLGGPRGWFDPRGVHESPTDTLLGHGTGVLSVAVGANVEGISLGIAPRARWTACIGLPDGRFDNIDIRLCADWLLQTAQPDIVVSAWKLPVPGCDSSLRSILEAWRAAEILVVFPAGNQGPEPGLNHSPANYSGLAPGGWRALSVGGYREDGSVYERSSRGPNACDGASMFPDLSAPAENLTVAFPASPTTYTRAEGTSYAAGIVAGVAALLLDAYPEASVSQLQRALRESALDLGPPGPDNVFGRGTVNVPAALRTLDLLLAGQTRDPVR